VLLNVSFIGFALWVAPHFHPPVLALGWAVLVGGALQLAFQVPFLVKLGMLPRLRPNFRDSGVWRVVRQMGPAVFGVSIGQISLLINTIFASFLVTGSVSWLYYADRLMEFPTGMLGVALGTILLPSLSKRHAESSPEEYSHLLDWGMRLTLLLAVPAAVALAVLAVPLVATLFHYGQFGEADVFLTRNAVVAYSAGLVGLILVKVLAPGFYARQDIRTPVKCALVTLFATQALNLALIWPLGHAGLALAIALGACLNAAMLFVLLRRKGIYIPAPGWREFLWKLGVAVVAMALALGAGTHYTEWLHVSPLTRVMQLTLLIVAGAVVYLGLLAVLGFRLRDYAKRA
jgi:putative peptidoglycan lipid II flippase